MKASIVFFAFLSIRLQHVLAWEFPRPPSFPHAPNAPQQQKPMYGEASLHGPDDDIDIVSGSQFNGLRTYANLPYANCLSDAEAEKGQKYDIAILGAPFDTANWGAKLSRGGPELVTGLVGSGSAARGSRSQRVIVYIRACLLWKAQPCVTNITMRCIGKNPLQSWATIVDCGDVPLTWLDNNFALKQLDKTHRVISGRKASNISQSVTPRIVTLGGDHTTTLSALRSTHDRWGPVSVIHFDSHIDTWDPAVIGGGISDYAGLNHDTFLHIAHEEHLILNTSIHAGIRAPPDPGQRRHAQRTAARDLDKVGTEGVIKRIKDRVGGSKVYISVDIDVLDPAFAPGQPRVCLRDNGSGCCSGGTVADRVDGRESGKVLDGRMMHHVDAGAGMV
ncbi:agmatinase- variant [Apiospora phragmitis]|uniref:Agmatinase- variant n=1 Tax=Apiospora phragmitis TaxID=2905665 RepID=A0ABR1UTV4_9PEZI